MRSKKFEDYKSKYEKNWITKETLRKWVAIYEKLPDMGITAEEYQEITGEPYME